VNARGAGRPRKWRLVTCDRCKIGAEFTMDKLAAIWRHDIETWEANRHAFVHANCGGRLAYRKEKID
jgi:hypothetical protein